MADLFELYRVALVPRKQQLHFESMEFQAYSREEWIKYTFGKKYSFRYYKNEYWYVPSESDNSDTLIGRIGKKVTREENRPPEERLEEVIRDAWIASYIVVDPRPDHDGQKLAIQIQPSVGSPHSLIKRLAEVINSENIAGPFAIEIDQIIDTSHFWDFVEQNKGQLVSVTLDVHVPNMFGSSDELDVELRAIRDNENAHRLKMTLHNEDGALNAETKRVREAVAYTQRSSGNLSARAKGGRVYNSKNSASRVLIEGLETAGQKSIEILLSLKDRVLGRG